MSDNDHDLPDAGAFRARRSHLGAALALGSEMSNSWTVVDSSGATVCEFEYHLHLASQEWSVRDASGQALATMTRPEAHMHATFDIRLESGSQMTMRKASFAFAHETWRLEGTEAGDIDLIGDIASHNFDFADSHGTVVARASRPWVSVHDAYDVEVMALDPITALCAVVALDAVEHDGR